MPELLSVVDKNDNLIRPTPRSEVHKSQLWHRGVHVFLYDKKGNMIVQCRGPKKDKYPNKLDCAVSEHSLSGENYITTAKRGLKEELGISPPLKSLVHFRMVYGPKDYMICKMFECTYKGKIKPNMEISGIYFMVPDEVLRILKKEPSRLTPWFREMLKWKLGMRNRLETITTV